MNNKCVVCKEKFEDKYFDKEQDKCIIHSEKNINQIENSEFSILFSQLIVDFISNDKFNNLSMNHEIKNVDYYYKQNYIVIKNAIFPNMLTLSVLLITKVKKVYFENCSFYFDRINNLDKIDSIDFSNCTFYNHFYEETKSLSIDECNFNFFSYTNRNNTDLIDCKLIDSQIGYLILKNSSLSVNKSNVNNLMIFNNSKKENEYNILIENESSIKHFSSEMPTINNFIVNNSSFSSILRLNNFHIKTLNIENTTFENGISLNNTLIEKRCSFINSRIKNNTVNLSNTSLSSFKNFYKTELKVENRETARIIKDSFEQQNNIIEANKFYKLEMEKREEELLNDIKSDKNFFEYLVFKFHGLSSNHSQDWYLALFWIMIIGFISSYFDFNLKKENGTYINFDEFDILKTFGLVLLIFILSYLCEVKDKIVNGIYYLVSSYLIYIYSTEDYLLTLFAKTINPSSVLKSNEPINGIQLVFKIIIAYLIYQFIISIRQNTRRK